MCVGCSVMPGTWPTVQRHLDMYPELVHYMYWLSGESQQWRTDRNLLNLGIPSYPHPHVAQRHCIVNNGIVVRIDICLKTILDFNKIQPMQRTFDLVEPFLATYLGWHIGYGQVVNWPFDQGRGGISQNPSSFSNKTIQTHFHVFLTSSNIRFYKLDFYKLSVHNFTL